MALNVKLGPNFFSNELRGYADWAFAFFRENFQNSVDAGSKNINITIEKISNDVSRVVFEDDGKGMDLNTLENIYFVLGETSKGSGSNIGGYGRARILTCFAQNSYELYTGDLHVVGCGSEYTINKVESFHKGVKLIINVNTNINGREINLVEKLEGYLAYSYIDCNVFVNGEKWKNWSYCRNYRKSLSYGNVYTNNSKSPYLIVRVNGTLMFYRYLSSSDTQIIIEITPELSRKVLLSNRDGFVSEYQRELDSFISEIQIDKVSALRVKNNKSFLFNGTGNFNIKKENKKNPILNANDLGKDYRSLSPSSGCYNPCLKMTDTSIVDNNENSSKQLNSGHKFFNILVLDDDVTNSKVKKVINRFYPSNWDLYGEDKLVNGQYKVIRKGVENFKLINIWKIICEEVLKCLMKTNFSPESINWGVGFIFSEKYEAMNLTENGINNLLINPVNDNGIMRYKISKKSHLIELITLAIHEISHIISRYHDENFASVMTDITKNVIPNVNNIVSLIKKYKNIQM